MATQTSEQTVVQRQAPFLEDYARKLLESAYQKSGTAIDIPDIQIAGFTPEQQKAVTMTKEGIGGFQPFLTGAEKELDAISLKEWELQEEDDIAEGAREFFLYEIEDLSWSTQDRKKLDNYTPIP